MSDLVIHGLHIYSLASFSACSTQTFLHDDLTLSFYYMLLQIASSVFILHVWTPLPRHSAHDMHFVILLIIFIRCLVLFAMSHDFTFLLCHLLNVMKCLYFSWDIAGHVTCFHLFELQPFYYINQLMPCLDFFSLVYYIKMQICWRHIIFHKSALFQH